MLCLKATKKTQIGNDVVPSLYPAITLASRVADHEMGVVRLILSYVGTNNHYAMNDNTSLAAIYEVGYAAGLAAGRR
jgi:hypothetical protein